MMDKFKKDWKAATWGERIAYVLIMFWTLFFGATGIAYALLFAVSMANDRDEYQLLIGVAICVGILIFLSRLGWRQTKTKKGEK